MILFLCFVDSLGKGTIITSVAKTDAVKTLFKASEDDRLGYLRESEDRTPGELQQAKGTRVLIGSKVRLEAFPNSLSMSV